MLWVKSSEDEKQSIIKLCHTRRKAHAPKLKPLA